MYNRTPHTQFFVVVITLFLVCCLPLALSAAEKAAPIVIGANHVTSYAKKNTTFFKGDVDVKQGDVHITSDEMTVYHSPAKKGAKIVGEKPTQQIEKLDCVGNVRVTRGEWLGTSKKMVYYQKKRQVILSGNAKAWQGQNQVAGDKIIYYLDEGRSEVVGGRPGVSVSKGGTKPKKKRVNMTIIQN